MSVIIRGASFFGESTADMLIADGVIREVGKVSTAASRTIDANGLIALPGLVDLHTHLREPGGEGSETILSGSRAAASGGFTVVHAMANTDPVADSASIVEQVFERGFRAGYVTVRPVGAVTRNLEGEQLADIGAMSRSRAGVTVFSDDGKCVGDPLLMRRALEYVSTFGGVIAQHSQDPRLSEGSLVNEGVVSSSLGFKGWPSVAEEAIIARDVLIAEYVGARLHVCHVSTAGSVDVIRWAKRRGIPVTAEVTPHHLMLTEDRALTHSTLFKVNPPLRASDDVEELRRAVADGTIDVVATDHAPHPTSSKDRTWNEASFGMVGLESALPVVIATLVETGLASWRDVARIMSVAPAAIGRVGGYGAPLQVGTPANITLVDPTVKAEWNEQRLRGRSSNTPYGGMELPGRIVGTLFGGIETVVDGVVVDSEAVRRS